ncbi:MAG: helix-turn-helix transcriptional regulator [Candidatus Pacebacteria bacterium]|nr:helix-turn-helix transcriptional regulator [Candidatus Paceibacterota bacterium]
MNRMKNYFYKNVKFLREQKRLTQSELAEELNKKEKLDIKEATIGHWENNIRTPKIETILKVAHYFNVGSEIIFNDIKNNIINYTLDEEEQDLKNLGRLLKRLGYMKGKNPTKDEMKKFLMWYEASRRLFDE